MRKLSIARTFDLLDQGLASAGTHRPDIVLMDLRLAHEGSGAEAACQIYKTFGIRSIVVSANIDATAREALQDCEPIVFVAKPLRPAEFDGALRNYHAY
jgi:DNA-binding NarL/FixJ family response regulator